MKSTVNEKIIMSMVRAMKSFCSLAGEAPALS